MADPLRSFVEDERSPMGIDQELREAASGIAVEAVRIPGSEERESFLEAAYAAQYKRFLDAGSDVADATDHADRVIILVRVMLSRNRMAAARQIVMRS